jgi:hypothetical protein
MEGGGMPKRGGDGFGVLYIHIYVKPPPVTAWSAEDAAKLAAVLGAPSIGILTEGVKLLDLGSAESVFK